MENSVTSILLTNKCVLDVKFNETVDHNGSCLIEMVSISFNGDLLRQEL